MDRTENDKVAELAQEATATKIIDLQKLQAVVVHNNSRLQSIKSLLDEYRERPERIKKTVTLHSAHSLIEYTNRFKDGRTVVFANRHTCHFYVALDYHQKDAPEWLDHNAQYIAEQSKEWQRWSQKSDIFMDQRTFCEFVDERMADLVAESKFTPGTKELGGEYGLRFASPAEILNVSQGLTVNIKNKVKSHVNQSNGTVSLEFTTEHSGEGNSKLSVPTAFVIGIPVYALDVRYQLPVRLRYRIRDSAVEWCFSLLNKEQVFEDAFQGLCTRIRTETSLPLFEGVL